MPSYNCTFQEVFPYILRSVYSMWHAYWILDHVNKMDVWLMFLRSTNVYFYYWRFVKEWSETQLICYLSGKWSRRRSTRQTGGRSGSGARGSTSSTTLGTALAFRIFLGLRTPVNRKKRIFLLFRTSSTNAKSVFGGSEKETASLVDQWTSLGMTAFGRSKGTTLPPAATGSATRWRKRNQDGTCR